MTTLNSLRAQIGASFPYLSQESTDVAEIDQALRHALWRYAQTAPQVNEYLLTLQMAAWDIDLSFIPLLIDVLQVVYPMDEKTQTQPAALRGYALVWVGQVPFLRLDAPRQPMAGEVIDLWVSQRHTIAGLDGAAATSVPEVHLPLLVQGTVAQAARARLLRRADGLAAPAEALKNLQTFAAEQTAQFEEHLRHLERRSWSGIFGGWEV